MRTEPIEHKFNKPVPYPISFQIYKGTKITSYGYIDMGKIKDYTIDIYVAKNNNTNKIKHKLYYLKKAGQWIKSKLIYFSDNKPYKVIRCENTNVDRITGNKFNSK